MNSWHLAGWEGLRREDGQSITSGWDASTRALGYMGRTPRYSCYIGTTQWKGGPKVSTPNEQNKTIFAIFFLLPWS